jgi:tetratricopeptide (TPR) repeat protein
MKERRSPGILLVVLACVAGGGTATAGAADGVQDPALPRAEIQVSGDPRQAGEAFREWLEAHPRPTDAATGELYVDALFGLYEAEPDARLLQHYLSQAPLDSLPEAGRPRVLEALAALLDELGDLPGAQRAYEGAAAAQASRDAPAASRSLLRSAALLYEQGDSVGSMTRAMRVLEGARARSDREAASGALYLLGRINAATGESEAALTQWREVGETYAETTHAAAAWFGIYALAGALERSEDAAAALATLDRRYPRSPERELAQPQGGVHVALVPRPVALLEPYLAPTLAEQDVAVPGDPTAVHVVPEPTSATASRPAAGPSPDSTAGARVAVLVGSYTVRENAERHRAELRRRGFEASLQEIEVGSVRYFRVLVGEAGSREAARELIQRLKDKDFESTLLVLGTSRSD